MTDKEVIIDDKYIKCPCYIDRPFHRYDKGCLIQSQAFHQQQTKEKPILRCDEIKNCPIKENYKQLQRKEQECKQQSWELGNLGFKIKNQRKEINNRLAQIERLQAENEDWKQKYYSSTTEVKEDLIKQNNYLKEENKELKELNNSLRFPMKDTQYAVLTKSEFEKFNRYKQALEEVEKIAKEGLTPICYKANCNRCVCYNAGESENPCADFINEYFTEDGEFVDENQDFGESFEGLIEEERKRCNRAKPISENILKIINKLKEGSNER